MRGIIAGLALAVLGTGCQPTCQSTCNRYYSVDECDAKPAGIDEDEALQLCLQTCSDALDQPGPAPSPTDARFSPTNSAPPTRSPQIENELEAAAWMDCVWSFEDRDECQDKLNKQVCVQVF